MILPVERLLLRLGAWPWILLPLALAWATAVPCGYTLDDLTLVQRDPRVLELRWGALFTTPLWPIGGGGGLYRPLLLLSFALEQRLHGSVHLMHLTNVLLHLGVCLLLRPVLSTLLDPRGTAAAALLFAVHPLHVEAVTGLVGRAELLALLGGLLAWRCLLPVPGPPSWPRAGLGGLAFLGALLCKESALTLIPVIALHACLLARRAGAPLRPALSRLLPLLGALAAVIALRLLLLGPGGAAPTQVPASLNPLAASPLGERLATGLVLLTRYAWLCVYPVRLVADYSFAAIPVEPGLLAWRPALALLGWSLAFLGAARLARRGEPVPLLALTWFVLLLGSVLQVVPIGAMFAERFAYAPSLAACMLVGWVLQRARPEGPAPLALLVVALACAGRTALRSLDFRDNTRLFAVTARDQPRSAQAQLYRAFDLLERGQLQAAVPHLAAAREIDPRQGWAALQLGRCLRRLDRPGEAAPHLEAARALEPHDPRPPLELALALAASRAAPDRQRALIEEALRLGAAPADRRAAADELRRVGAHEALARALEPAE